MIEGKCKGAIEQNIYEKQLKKHYHSFMVYWSMVNLPVINKQMSFSMRNRFNEQS